MLCMYAAYVYLRVSIHNCFGNIGRGVKIRMFDQTFFTGQMKMFMRRKLGNIFRILLLLLLLKTVYLACQQSDNNA